MTAIAGIVVDGTVWMGGDCAATDGLSMERRIDPKVFINSEFLFGYATSFRMGQLLEHEFNPPTPTVGESDMSYMVKRFVPAAKDCFHSGGFQRRADNDGNDVCGTFLVGYRGQLYCIEGDYQVGRAQQSYAACGCSRDLVLGSLHTTSELDLSPDVRITMALNAAAEFSAGVRSPFIILSLPQSKSVAPVGTLL